MNYPTTVTNPLLKKHQQVAIQNTGISTKPDSAGPPSKLTEKVKRQNLTDIIQFLLLLVVKFSNHERPVSCPQVPMQRPFSSHFQSGLKFQPTKVLSKAGADKISSATIAHQLEARQKLAASQAAEGAQDGASQGGGDVGAGSRMDLGKQSMLSVTESVQQEDA